MTDVRPERSKNKLKIALIVDSKFSSKYVCDLAEWGQQQNTLEVSHLIIQNIPSPPRKSFLRKIVEPLKKQGVIYLAQMIAHHIIYKAVHAIESGKLKRSKNYSQHLSSCDLSKYVKAAIFVNPIISKSGFVYRYGDADIQEIRKLNFDVLIRCGSGILRGEILNAATFGIISFHHADNRINRGGPAGFWEVYLRQESTGFTIQQLTEELDGGNVLFRGHLPTKSLHLLNQAALYEKSNFYLKALLIELAETLKLPETLESYPYCSPLYKRPDLPVLFNYFVSVVVTVFAGYANHILLKKVRRWSVAFSFSDWRNLVMWRAVKIKNPPNHFLADPFVVSFENENYCFVEDYDYSESRACIAAYKLYEKYAERIGEVIVEPFHLSYPYIFEYESKYYMCPESAENKDIRLYECESFPRSWKLKKIVMSNVSAADTMIFEKDGTWWLFTNIDPTSLEDHCSELFIYYADNPLTDEWTPHPKNPIFVNSMKARNGGILFDGDQIYRVSQQQGYDRYGKAASINKIMRLSKTDYVEETLFKIEPGFNKALGTHHMHSNGKVTVFDYVERVKLP
jgi:hypothetical protein